eukprot:12905037-Prorocentrum_lima.AAC.1
MGAVHHPDQFLPHKCVVSPRKMQLLHRREVSNAEFFDKMADGVGLREMPGQLQQAPGFGTETGLNLRQPVRQGH